MPYRGKKRVLMNLFLVINRRRLELRRQRIPQRRRFLRVLWLERVQWV
jgi:hypothetical protein